MNKQRKPGPRTWFLYLDDMYWHALSKAKCNFIAVPIKLGGTFVFLVNKNETYEIKSGENAPGHGTLTLDIKASRLNFLNYFLPQVAHPAPTKKWPWKRIGEGFRLTIKDYKGNVLHVFPECFIDPDTLPMEQLVRCTLTIGFTGYAGVLTQLTESKSGKKKVKKG